MNELVPPILIHFNELGDRLAVWYSSGHPDNLSIKKDLKELGYLIETFSDVYAISGPELGKIKTALEVFYGIPEDDRSGESLHEKEPA